MATMNLGPKDAIYYEHAAPADDAGFTFVFFNALTGDTGMWEGLIGPRLRDAGHGTLVYNLRGQPNSPFSPGTVLDTELIVDDAVRLLQEVKPVRAIFVGLSIGGLFAARAWLKGAEAVGLVFINTLRSDGPRLRWINDALIRCIEVAGMDLFRDLMTPHLFDEEWLGANRSNFLKPETAYLPIDKESGHYNLLLHSGKADWDLPYERLDLPTLVVSGLQDRVFYKAEVVEALFARLPRGQRVDMPDAGHLIPAERPEAMADALLRFARGL